MSEFDIQIALYHFLRSNGRKNIVPNIWFMAGEMDILCMTQSNYVHEFEIKISRSDFFADKKKIHKHNIYSGQTKPRHYNKGTSYFWYAVPNDLISVDEIPDYAGLVYVSRGIQIIRNAPKLPCSKKLTLEEENSILRGCYYRMWNLMEKMQTGIQATLNI